MVSGIAQTADLSALLIPLLRPLSGSIAAYLETCAANVSILGTQTHAHCHFVALDGNKRPRVSDFARFVGEKITDFAIPRSEVQRAIEEAARLRSTAPIDRLNAKARNLFTHLPQSGEGGEVLLSVLTEHFLGFPQMFTKMVLKTNPQMHGYGSDGIHAGVNKTDGNLALYWGESKLYQDGPQGIRACFGSLGPFLLGAGGSGAAQQRDLELMRDGLDLNDPELEEALKHYLDPNDPQFKRLEYRGVCLVGFDSSAYPAQPNSKDLQQLMQDIQSAFVNCQTQISNRVIAECIHTFEIEIFCLPFPSVEEFRQAFRRELGLL